ncbi:PRC-barrel domain-containing protein [Sphingomonas sp. MMS24-JH45]
MKVEGRDGDTLGTVHALMVHKGSGRTTHAVLSLGGFLGMGKKLLPDPVRPAAVRRGARPLRGDGRPAAAGGRAELGEQRADLRPGLCRPRRKLLRRAGRTAGGGLRRGVMSEQDTKSGIEEAVEELLTNPDSPENSDTTSPPQTIDAEPERNGRSSSSPHRRLGPMSLAGDRPSSHQYQPSLG